MKSAKRRQPKKIINKKIKEEKGGEGGGEGMIRKLFPLLQTKDNQLWN